MMIKSEFDTAMIEANQAIMNVFATEYSLTLSDNSAIPLTAIFDTQLISMQGEKSIFKKMPNGILTVHNQRLDKDKFIDANVITELGARTVADVLYPEENTSILVLTALKKSKTQTNQEYY